MVEHPDFPRLQAAVARLCATAISFEGVLFRACAPSYANSRDLLTGEGASKSGGRWNPPGSFPVVYLAESLEGAIAETLGVAAHYGLDPAARLPMTLVALDATLERVLDLTNAVARKSLGITLTEISNCPWRDENAAGREAITQAIARAAHAAGLQGLLVPSSLKRTFRNLNVFPLNLGTTGVLSIRSADKLPPPPAPGVI